MKITAVLDLMNRYQSRVLVDGIILAAGNRGLEDIQLVSRGKRTFVQITLSNAEVILIGEECPEKFRYHVIRQFQGNERLRQLNLVCDLLQVSLNACDGCAKNPDRT